MYGNEYKKHLSNEQPDSFQSIARKGEFRPVVGSGSGRFDARVRKGVMRQALTGQPTAGRVSTAYPSAGPASKGYGQEPQVQKGQTYQAEGYGSQYTPQYTPQPQNELYTYTVRREITTYDEAIIQATDEDDAIARAQAVGNWIKSEEPDVNYDATEDC